MVVASKDREATKRYLARLSLANVPVVPGARHGLTLRVDSVPAAGEKLAAAGLPLLTPAPVPTAEGLSWTVDGAATGGLALELVGGSNAPSGLRPE